MVQPKRKARATKKTPEVEESKEEDAKAKAEREKEKAEQKAGDGEKADPKNEQKPKPRAKRGAKSKAAPKTKTEKKGGKKGEEEEEDSEDIPTPRKKLFQSDEEGAEQDLRLVDPKGDKVKPLKEILDEEVPKNWSKSRAKRATVAEAEAAASPPKPKGNRGKKVQLSPFAKKEVNRRKKRNEEVMRMEAEEDLSLQGICVQHLKNVKGMDARAVKDYLLKKVHNQFNDFKLNTYWSRGCSGVKSLWLSPDGTLKQAPEIAYFGRYGTATSDSANMVLVYVSSALMVSKLHSFLKSLHFKKTPRNQVDQGVNQMPPFFHVCVSLCI